MMYRRAAGREGGNVEGPPGVFLQASCIRLEGFSARRDVCPQQPPITSIVFPWKASFYFSSSKERAPPRFLYRLSYNYVFTSRALDKQILSWSKTLAEKKNFFVDWCSRSRFIFEHLFCVASGERYFKVWRESSCRGINFNSDKNSTLRQGDEGVRTAGKRIKGWICRVGLFRSQDFDIGLKAHLFLFRYFSILLSIDLHSFFILEHIAVLLYVTS